MQTTRLTGSYYTSQRIANYMVEWALRDKSDSLLEPSFGDGVFLDAAFDRFLELGNNAPTVIGVELQPTVFSKYADSSPASFVGYCKDFMEYSQKTAFSAVVGNPPYVSLRNLKEADRTRAIDRTADYKIKMLSSGSLWMPFTIHASNMLIPNGRLAFVLPFEITYVKYAYPLWTYLGNNFGSIKVVRIHEDFFPDVDVETVLLFADECGENTHCVDFEIYDSVDALFADNISLKSKIEISDIIHRKKPFAFSMLDENQRNIIETLRKEKGIVPLIDLCKFNIGYVCADKEYFHPDKETCKRYKIPTTVVQTKTAAIAAAAIRRWIDRLGFCSVAGWLEIVACLSIKRSNDASASISKGSGDFSSNADRYASISPTPSCPSVADAINSDSSSVSCSTFFSSKEPLFIFSCSFMPRTSFCSICFRSAEKCCSQLESNCFKCSFARENLERQLLSGKCSTCEISE